MKDLGAVIIGAVFGAAVAVLYMNNGQEIKSAAKKVKAKSKRAMDIFNDMEEEMNNRIRR